MNQWSDLDEILGVAISAAVVDCLLNTFCSKVKDQGLDPRIRNKKYGGKMSLANNPLNLKLLPQTKFHPIWTTGSKVTAIIFQICEISKIRKLMAINFEPVVQFG